MASTLDQVCTDVAGRTWKGLRAQLRERHYSHCVLLAGTNDVSSDAPENIFRNVWRLAATASASGCVVYVLTIPELAAEHKIPSIRCTRTRVDKLILQSQGARLSQDSPAAHCPPLSSLSLLPTRPMLGARRLAPPSGMVQWTRAALLRQAGRE